MKTVRTQSSPQEVTGNSGSFYLTDMQISTRVTDSKYLRVLAKCSSHCRSGVEVLG